MGTDRERIRKEASRAVTSRPPSASGSHVDEAVRRYLGGEVYHALGHRKPPEQSDDDSPTEGATGRKP